MSTLRVNKITNANDDGPVEFTKGISVGSNYTISGPNGESRVVINTVGVVTATSFSGDGSGLTNLPGNGVAKSKALALTFIL